MTFLRENSLVEPVMSGHGVPQQQIFRYTVLLLPFKQATYILSLAISISVTVTFCHFLRLEITSCSTFNEMAITSQRLVTIFGHTVLSSTFDFKYTFHKKFNFMEFNQILMNFNMPEHYNTVYPGLSWLLCSHLAVH